MKRFGIAIPATLCLAACASVSTGWTDQVDRSATLDVPDHFLVVDRATGATSNPAGPACRNPMADPRDGARLTLVRSNAGFGDYRPDTPRYGLEDGQLLRVNCSDGTPVGATSGAP